MPTTCLIADDHTMFGQLVGGLLKNLCELEILDLPATVAEAIEAIDRHRPRLLILDLDFPDGPGTRAAEHLVASDPEARILVLSANAAQFVCPAPLLDHVLAVVDKTEAWDVLAAEVNAFLAQPSEGPAATHNPADVSVLTPREREVFRLLGEGLWSKEIARRLGLSLSTVESYRRQITAKLEISGSELIRQAVLHSLAHPLPPANP